MTQLIAAFVPTYATDGSGSSVEPSHTPEWPALHCDEQPAAEPEAPLHESPLIQQMLDERRLHGIRECVMTCAPDHSRAGRIFHVPRALIAFADHHRRTQAGRS